MTKQILIQALESEIAMLDRSYELTVGQAHSLLDSYAGRMASTHLGHNLANRATELSELAAKREQTVRILASVKEMA